MMTQAVNDNGYEKAKRYVVQDGADFYIFKSQEMAEQMDEEPLWICKYPGQVKDGNLLQAQAARIWFEHSTHNTYEIVWAE